MKFTVFVQRNWQNMDQKGCNFTNLPISMGTGTIVMMQQLQHVFNNVKIWKLFKWAKLETLVCIIFKYKLR